MRTFRKEFGSVKHEMNLLRRCREKKYGRVMNCVCVCERERKDLKGILMPSNGCEDTLNWNLEFLYFSCGVLWTYQKQGISLFLQSDIIGSVPVPLLTEVRVGSKEGSVQMMMMMMMTRIWGTTNVCICSCRREKVCGWGKNPPLTQIKYLLSSSLRTLSGERVGEREGYLVLASLRFLWSLSISTLLL